MSGEVPTHQLKTIRKPLNESLAIVIAYRVHGGNRSTARLDDHHAECAEDRSGGIPPARPRRAAGLQGSSSTSESDSCVSL